MKAGRALLAVNILIVVSLAAAVLLGGAVVSTATGPTPVLTIGSVIGVFSNGNMQLHVPVSVHDGGIIAIHGVFIDLTISDSAGHTMIVGSSGTFDVPAGTAKDVNVTLTANLKEIPQQEMSSLLTEDQSLTLKATLKASIPDLAGLSGSVSGTLPWGAMMENLTFGRGTVAPYNSTYSSVSWLYSLTNSNQYFRLLANVTGSISDQSGSVVGSVVPDSIELKRGTSTNGTLTALISNSALGSSGPSPYTANLQIEEGNLFQTGISVTLNA